MFFVVVVVAAAVVVVVIVCVLNEGLSNDFSLSVFLCFETDWQIIGANFFLSLRKEEEREKSFFDFFHFFIPTANRGSARPGSLLRGSISRLVDPPSDRPSVKKVRFSARWWGPRKRERERKKCRKLNPSFHKQTSSKVRLFIHEFPPFSQS